VEIQRVLCPVDFSEFSRRALDDAITISLAVREGNDNGRPS
jgi:hypothetical protein